MSRAKEVDLAPGKGTARTVLGVSFTKKASSADTAGAYFATEVKVEGEGPPVHMHSNDEEAIYVLDGTMEIESKGKTQKAKAGTFHLIPRGTPHTIRGQAKALLIFSPGETEQFMDEADGVVDENRVVEIAQKNGLSFVEPD